MINPRPAVSLFLLLAFIASPAGGQQTTPNSDVRVVVTVTDSAGRPLSGLTQEQFSFFEKKTPLEITYFDAEDKPASIAFIFDLSESFAPEMRKSSVQLANQIIRRSNQDNKYAIIGLKNPPEIFCELGCNEADTAKALQRVSAGETKTVRSTLLYDACSLALKQLETGTNAKRTLIVFGDGQDSGSNISFIRMREALKESGVIFYAIGLLRPSQAGTALAMEGEGILNELGAVTGGKAYFPMAGKETIQVADVIAMQLRQQYTIGFKPATQVADNKWHSIKIKLTMPKSGKSPAPYMRYREGYYSRR